MADLSQPEGRLFVDGEFRGARAGAVYENVDPATDKFTGKERPAGTRLGDNEWGKAALSERSLAIAAEVDRVAREVERSSSQVALAWVRSQKRSNLIPILGARRLAQLEDNLGALTLALSSEHLERLAAVSRIERGFPVDVLDRVEAQVYGETRAAIDVIS